MKFYIKRLNYDNAVKAINWINKKIANAYANITVQGVGVSLDNTTSDNDYKKIDNHLKSLDLDYDFDKVHPQKAIKQKVQFLKSKGLIK